MDLETCMHLEALSLETPIWGFRDCWFRVEVKL